MSKIDFLNKEFIRNPFPVYSEVREQEPVYRFLLPSGHYAWIVTRYDDAVKVLSDSKFIANPLHLNEADDPAEPPHKKIISRNLLSVNPADHRRLRRLVQKAFTPRMVERLRGRIEEIANELLDNVQDKGEMNLIEDYAFPLPIIVICEMLGIPHEDQDTFRKWSDVIMEGVNNPHFEQQSEEVMIAFVDYLRDLIARRRKELKEDLISDLISVEVEGDVLSEHEMYALVFVLIIAGHETTVNLIGNGILALLHHPDQKAKLQNQPELIHSAIEEMLRYDGPAEVSNIRWATEDAKLGGKTIRKGEMLFISFSSANRDPEKFADPDSFNITREANNHLAFGKGVHHCLGAPLARLEGEIAIGTLLRRMPDLRLKTNADFLEWRPGMIIRGLKEIPLLF
ncbi:MULTISPECIES: cytochrome P450 family protein [Bacillus]|uniref:cytochrome P450 family protein n=1 Tax=Bacillus TaxID=1386 RepID=UPI000814EF57|nr:MULTISPECIES: cytochrome P450 [Bacillus]MDU0070750.1 cytochrome P450 [Bacillus sp. IG6]MED8018678.1 cytochrome P450 [Bacillus glycinifermentans]WKB75880.1 cytochrome P450 [Bacillus glycinifermentans]SCA86900.1 cytochrome P450 [Bacillus glycinifermentans]